MMHVVLGDGEMTKRELSSTLEDLLEQAGDDPFWFLVHAKAEPTTTDTDLLSWLNTKGVYYEIVGDDLKATDAKLYANAQERYEVKRLGPKVLELMTERPDEGEPVNLLTLFVSNDEQVEEDAWLNEIVDAALAASFEVLVMNDGLARIALSGDEEAAEEAAAADPDPEPEPPAKPTKKAAAKAPRSLTAVPDPEPAVLSRDELEALDLDAVKVIAAERGIVLKDRTRKATYIDHLLGEADGTPEVELEATETALEAAQNGDSPMVRLDTGMIAVEVLQGMVNIIQAGLDAIAEEAG
jgi:hypothetical protein